MTKKCFKCCETKDLNDFYKHKEMSDGRIGKCKECAKKDVLLHRGKNIDKIRAYDRERANLPHRKKAAAAYLKKYRKAYPLRKTANSMVRNAIRTGRLVRPDKCEACKRKKKVCGHHKDYYKPLDVMWLCQPCHKKEHKSEVIKTIHDESEK